MVVRPIVCRRFIGREEELRYLHELRIEAARSHGSVVFVRGEAGAGKSRLLREFCGSLVRTRWRVGVGRCLEFAQRPYAPVLEVLDRIDRSGGELVPAASKREQFDAIVARFTRVAERSAVVVVIEDLHWADAATLEFLAYFAAKLSALRILLLASFRPEEAHDESPVYARLATLLRTPAATLTLPPLTEAERVAFIDDALGDVALTAHTRRHVARVAEGNPFFTEELLKSAVERGEAGASFEQAMPTSVRAVLSERLRPLSPDERRVIVQAAVIGRRFDVGTLRGTLQNDAETIEAALQRGRRLQLIEEEPAGRFRFRHALTREAIYDQMLGVQLRPMHRTIAELLEAQPDAQRSLESLAYHWLKSGDGERGARYSELAGDAAAAVHAHGDAIALYERGAANLPPNALARAHLLEKIGHRYVALASTNPAYDAFAAAADIFAAHGDDEREAACRVQQAISDYSAGRAEPIAPLEAMLRRLPADRALARSRVHLGIAWLTSTFADPATAEQHVDRVDAQAIEAMPDIRLRVHNIRAWTAMTVGDAVRFRNELRSWIAAAEDVDTPGARISPLCNGAFCATVLALHDEAIALARTGIAMAQTERNVSGERTGWAHLACAAVFAGDLALAREALQPLADMPINNAISLAHEAAWGSLTAAYLDDHDLIRRWFDETFEAVTPLTITLCGGGFAEILARRGRVADARALLARRFPALGDLARGMPFTLLAAARYGAQPEVDDARRRLCAIAALPHETLERFVLPLFDAQLAARHGDRAASSRFAREAAPGLQRLGVRLLAASAYELAGDRAAALALYEQCGAAYDVRRLRPQRTPLLEPTARDLLSARERSIALLVATGKSNVEIGRALGISHKTVEKHLGRAYEKLGFSTRAQLGAFISKPTEPAAHQ